MEASLAEDAYQLYQRARIMMESDRLEEAVELFSESNKLSPHFKTLELEGECLIRLGRLKESIIPLAAAAGLNKGVRAASLLASVFLELGDLHRARELAEEALSRDSNNRQARQVMQATEDHYQRLNA